MRLSYGGGVPDWIIEGEDEGDELVHPVLLPNTSVSFWDARDPEDGNQYTDLLDPDGDSTDVIITNESGFLPMFQGPDEDPPITVMYAQAGAGERFAISTSEIGSYVFNVADQATQALSDAQDALDVTETFDSRLGSVETTQTSIQDSLSTVQGDFSDLEDTVGTFENSLNDLAATRPRDFVTLDDLSIGDGNTVICGHRGSNGYFPENSLYAIRRSVQHGLGIVEIDVQSTLGGGVIMLHDEDTRRTMSAAGYNDLHENVSLRGKDLVIRADHMTRDNAKLLQVDWNKNPGVFLRDDYDPFVDNPEDLSVSDRAMPNANKESLSFLEDVFDEFAGRINFILDCKTGEAITNAIPVIEEYNMGDSVIFGRIGIGNLSELDSAISGGYDTVVFSNNVLNQTELQDAFNAGVRYIGYYNFTPSSNDVDNIYNEGLEYIHETTDRMSDFEAAKTTSENGSGTNRLRIALTGTPVYLSGYYQIYSGKSHIVGRGNPADHAPNNPTNGLWHMEGMHSHHVDRGGYSTNPDNFAEKLSLPINQVDEDSGPTFNFHIPWNPLIFNPADSYAVSCRVMVESDSVSDGAGFGMYFGCVNDYNCSFSGGADADGDTHTDFRGYLGAYRPDGVVALHRIDGPGSSTEIDFSSGETSYSAGASRRITATVTPSQISFYRADSEDYAQISPSGVELTSSDTDYRGMYLWIWTYRLQIRIRDIFINEII